MTTNNAQYFNGKMHKITISTYVPPRQCIREDFHEGPAPGCVQGCWLKVWTYHYSDGTTEQLRRIIEK